MPEKQVSVWKTPWQPAIGCTECLNASCIVLHIVLATVSRLIPKVFATLLCNSSVGSLGFEVIELTMTFASIFGPRSSHSCVWMVFTAQIERSGICISIVLLARSHCSSRSANFWLLGFHSSLLVRTIHLQVSSYLEWNVKTIPCKDRGILSSSFGTQIEWVAFSGSGARCIGISSTKTL